MKKYLVTGTFQYEVEAENVEAAELAASIEYVENPETDFKTVELDANGVEIHETRTTNVRSSGEPTLLITTCPACEEDALSQAMAENSLSRYRPEYICSDCGTREALEGDFWGKK